MALRLLVVTAHPDDEAGGFGGALLKYRDQGVETFVICLTEGQAASNRGSAGKGPDSGPALAQLRRAEFAASCKVLNVSSAEVLTYRDGGLPATDFMTVVGDIVQRIREIRPHVILTFGTEGSVTTHPDHTMASLFTTAAFHWAGRSNRFPEQLGTEQLGTEQLGTEQLKSEELKSEQLQNAASSNVGSTDASSKVGSSAHGNHAREKKQMDEKQTPGTLTPWRAHKLYYSTAPVIMPDRQPVSLAPATAILDITPYLERKIQAFHAHTTQAPLFDRFDNMMRSHGPKERYHLASTIEPTIVELEVDLFAGITLDHGVQT